MKKPASILVSFTLATSLLLISCVSAKAADDLYAEPEEIAANAISIEPCEWKAIENPYEAAVPPMHISAGELEDDLEDLCYLLKTSYAGFEDACGRGLNLEELKADIQAQFEDSNDISTDDFFLALKDELSGKIQDMHFSLALNKWQQFFCDTFTVHYTDIFLQKRGNAFTVCEIGERAKECGIPLGEPYTGSPELMFYYPARGCDVYRIGRLIKTPVGLDSESSGDEKKCLPSVSGEKYMKLQSQAKCP